jgi:hypothetical protein
MEGAWFRSTNVCPDLPDLPLVAPRCAPTNSGLQVQLGGGEGGGAARRHHLPVHRPPSKPIPSSPPQPYKVSINLTCATLQEGTRAAQSPTRSSPTPGPLPALQTLKRIPPTPRPHARRRGGGEVHSPLRKIPTATVPLSGPHPTSRGTATAPDSGTTNQSCALLRTLPSPAEPPTPGHGSGTAPGAPPL